MYSEKNKFSIFGAKNDKRDDGEADFDQSRLNQSYFMGQNRSVIGTRRGTGIGGERLLVESFFRSKDRSQIIGSKPTKRGNESLAKPMTKTYSPFLTNKRNMDEVGEQSFYTPNKTPRREVDDDSTTKPNLHQNTVLRNSQFAQFQTIRSQNNVGRYHREGLPNPAASFNSYPRQTMGQQNSRLRTPGVQKRSPEFGMYQKNSPGGRSNSVIDGEQYQTPFTTDIQENIYDKMTKDQKNVAIYKTRQIVEDIAANQASIITNDLGRQFDNMIQDDRFAVTGIVGSGSSLNNFEFEPLLLQASSEKQIPNQIRDEISRQNKESDSGILTAQIVYFIIEKVLILWDADTTVKTPMDFNRIEFKQEINEVCYVENYKDNFKPYLCVATNSEIQFIQFEENALSRRNQKITNEKSKFNQASFLNSYKYNLTEIKHRPDLVLTLEIDEVACKIIQFKKTGRIYMASNTEDFLNFQIKEIFIQSEEGGLTVFDYPLIKPTSNKKLKSINVEQQSQTMIKNIFDKIVPGFLNFTKTSKKLIDMKIDEQRNLMYALSKGASEDFPQAYIEIYDLGIYANQMQKVCTITQDKIVQALKDNIGLLVGNTSKQEKQNYQYQMREDFFITSIQPIQQREGIIRQLLITTFNGLRIYIELIEQHIDLTGRLDHKTIEGNQIQFDDLQPRRPTYNWNIVSVHSLPFEEDAEKAYEQCPIPFQVSTINRMRPQKRNKEDFEIPAIYSNQTSSLFYALQNGAKAQLDSLQLCAITKNDSALACYKEIIDEDGLQNNKQKMPELFALAEIQKLDENERVEVMNILNPNNEMLADEDQNQNRMLGYNKSLLLGQGWGMSNSYQYMPLNMLEKQVYANSQVIQVVTNYRSMSFKQIKPIDMLAKILKNIDVNSQTILDEFEDFAQKFTIQEVCNMLVQIVSDGSEAEYISSKQMDQATRNAIAWKRQQIQLDGQQQYQPRQNNSQYKSPFSSNSRFQAGPANSKRMRGGLGKLQNNGNNFKLPYQYLVDEDDMNKNTYVQKLELRSRINLAQDLLIVYGDSILRNNIDEFSDLVKDRKQAFEFDSKISCVRIQALLTYIQRILRPVWDMKICYREKFDDKTKQFSNMEMFIPALMKLKNFQNLIEKHQSLLTKKTTKEDQAKLLGQVHVLNQKRGICNPQILNALIFSHELTNEEKDRLEVAERKAFTNMIVFVQRCIDIIEFIKSISVNDSFSKILQKIKKPETLDEISNMTYSSLVLLNNEADKNLMKDLYEKACLVAPGGANTTASIKRQAANISYICPTIFVPEDTFLFAGETILDQARKELDGNKQKNMIQEAVEQLLKQPKDIDLSQKSQIISFLRETHNFMTIVDICLRKAEYLKRSLEFEQDLDSIVIRDKIIECYNVIILIFSALSQDIDDNSRNKKDSGIQYKDQMFIAFYRHFKKAELKDQLQQKINFKIRMLRLIDEQNDCWLTKPIFKLMIQQSNFQMVWELPKLEFQKFNEICTELLFDQVKFPKSCLDAMIKLMADPKYYGHIMKKRLSELVIRLVENNDLIILVEVKDSRELHESYLNCSQKIEYCQMALDNLSSGSDSTQTLNFKVDHYDKEVLQQYKIKLINLIEHLRHQLNIIDDLDKKIEKGASTEKLNQLKQAKNALNTTFVDQENIEHRIFESLKLYDLKLKALKEKWNQVEECNRYNGQNSSDLFELQREFRNVFEEMMESIDTQKQDVVKESFVNLMVLTQYCQNEQVLTTAINYIWTSVINGFTLETKDDPYDLITNTMSQLLDSNNFQVCRPVELLVYLYFACDQLLVDGLTGTTLFQMFCQHHDTLSLSVSCALQLLSMHVWSQIAFSNECKIDKISTTKLVEKANSKFKFSNVNSMKANLCNYKTKAMLLTKIQFIDQVMQTNTLVWPKDFGDQLERLSKVVRKEVQELTVDQV